MWKRSWCTSGGLPPQATYTFKHALIQDAAYQSLLRSTRQQYHQRIAQVMEAQFADVAEIQPELLAHHYSEAGLAALALPYYQQAGAKAVARSAYREAVALFERALGVMQHLPDSPDTIAQAIDLRLALRTALRLLGEFDVPWWCCTRPRPSQRRSAMHVGWDRSRSIWPSNFG